MDKTLLCQNLCCMSAVYRDGLLRKLPSEQWRVQTAVTLYKDTFKVSNSLETSRNTPNYHCFIGSLIVCHKNRFTLQSIQQVPLCKSSNVNEHNIRKFLSKIFFIWSLCVKKLGPTMNVCSFYEFDESFIVCFFGEWTHEERSNKKKKTFRSLWMQNHRCTQLTGAKGISGSHCSLWSTFMLYLDCWPNSLNDTFLIFVFSNWDTDDFFCYLNMGILRTEQESDPSPSRFCPAS